MGDYARIIVDAFVARRGHGSAISSLDQALVLKWERLGVPLGVVLDAVDECFRKRREPPSSLHDCARHVKSAFEKWALGAAPDSNGAAVQSEVPTALGPASSEPATTPARERANEVLMRQASAAATARGSAVLARLAAEVERHFGHDVALVDVPEGSMGRAFFALAWSSLDDDERAKCEQIARAAVAPGLSPRVASALFEQARAEAVAVLLGVGLLGPTR